LQRVVILGPETGVSQISAILVRLPPHHEFSMHTHPRAEDCFFVISGEGEVFEPDRRLSLSASTGVWIPPGVPHGLAAGASGVLEIGFQSPPDPTAVPYDAAADGNAPRGFLTAQLPGEADARWYPTFPHRTAWQHLDPYSCTLNHGQSVSAEAADCELLIVVVRGAVEVQALGANVEAIAALHLGPTEITEVRARRDSTVLLGIRARPMT